MELNSSLATLHWIAKILYDQIVPNKGSKVAVITGGTTGIGGASARELAANGYRLLLVALSDPSLLVPELRAAGARVEFLHIDLTDSERAAKAIVASAITSFGRIDLVVNCAGVISHKDPELVSEVDWDQIFAVNLKAPFFLAQQALPHLKESGGSIINLSSINSFRPARKNQLYDSLKAALNNLTAGLALEYRESGVRVNAIAPGGVRTPLVEQWLEEYLGQVPTEKDFDIPSLAKPEQIAKVVVALASEEMSWINGVTLPVDGGYGL
jgi:NAD(P)-dependent dehydrogenase (short-subunit alcohol dehydrogenase family)